MDTRDNIYYYHHTSIGAHENRRYTRVLQNLYSYYIMYVYTRAKPFWRATHSRDDDGHADRVVRAYYILYVIIIIIITIRFNDRRATEILTTPPRRHDDVPDANDTNNGATSFSATIRIS